MPAELAGSIGVACVSKRGNPAQVARDVRSYLVRGNSMTESQGIQLLLGTSSTRPVPSTRLWTMAHGAMLACEGVVQPALERVDDDSDSSSQTLSWRRMGQLHGPAPKAESKGAAAKRPAAKQIAAKRPAAKRIAAKRPAAKKGIAAKRPAAKVALRAGGDSFRSFGASIRAWQNRLPLLTWHASV